ncbi:protein-disulfide reductase DsbD family protein [Novosphingobium piscinae]|nr:protein-disulfide reductase DsbD [Novosphingobium piscinae]
MAVAGPVQAQPGAPNHIAAALRVEGPAAPGSTVMVALEMKPAKGWHGYWSNPGDAGFGMTLKWYQGDVAADADFGTPLYPVPDTLLIAGLMNHVYEHDYAVLVPYRVPAAARPGSVLPIAVKAQWLACTDAVCVPEQARLEAGVTVTAPGAASPASPQFDQWRARLPAPLGSPARIAAAGPVLRLGIPLPQSVALERPHVFVADEALVDYAAPQEFRRQGDLLVVTLRRNPAAGAGAAPAALHGVLKLNRAGDGVTFTAAPGAVAAGGALVAEGADAPSTPLVWLVLAALAGGLLLNVMPCVFPILSLKALSLARAGESEAEARTEGLAYTAGVVLACSALGAVLLALRAGGSEVGWAFQLQDPSVVALLLLLALAITANLAGVYEFAVPGFVNRASSATGGTGSRSGGANGAFATGLLAAFVATPCTGPFMAAAMGAALLLPVAEAMLLFVALGVGLALPFLAIAFVPPLRRALPRPGGWMVRFRHAMAVPMGLTALALAWLTWRLAGPVILALELAVALAAGLLLVELGRRQRRGAGVARLGGGGLVALGLAAALVPVAIAPQAPAAARDGLPSQPFSAAALAQARASGKPVFVWMTADWCLTCKVNERVAIDRAETRAAFAGAEVVVLKGDWTRRDPEITRYLGAQGAAGVPLYVWYPGPAPAAPVTLPQLLTPDSLVALTQKVRS